MGGVWRVNESSTKSVGLQSIHQGLSTHVLTMMRLEVCLKKCHLEASKFDFVWLRIFYKIYNIFPRSYSNPWGQHVLAWVVGKSGGQEWWAWVVGKSNGQNLTYMGMYSWKLHTCISQVRVSDFVWISSKCPPTHPHIHLGVSDFVWISSKCPPTHSHTHLGVSDFVWISFKWLFMVPLTLPYYYIYFVP